MVLSAAYAVDDAYFDSRQETAFIGGVVVPVVLHLSYPLYVVPVRLRAAVSSLETYLDGQVVGNRLKPADTQAGGYEGAGTVVRAGVAVLLVIELAGVGEDSDVQSSERAVPAYPEAGLHSVGAYTPELVSGVGGPLGVHGVGLHGPAVEEIVFGGQVGHGVLHLEKGVETDPGQQVGLECQYGTEYVFHRADGGTAEEPADILQRGLRLR